MTTERKGSLINWRAECGHWMVCYSLEPTPPQCPDCTDKGRNALEISLKRWRSDLSSAATAAEDCTVEDVAIWLSEDGISAPTDVLGKLQSIADMARDAYGDLEQAERDIRGILAALPVKAERLTISEAS